MARHKVVDGVQVPFTPEEEAERDLQEAQWETTAPVREARKAIKDLESLETDRRKAEAILTEEGKLWLQNNRAQITALRAQLAV